MKIQNQQTKGFILNAKTITLFLIFLFSFSFSKAQTYTYRIQEISTNPNCGGTYQVFAAGTSVSPPYNYSYPGNINKQLPVAFPYYFNCSGALPDSIHFSSVTLCSPINFTIPINGTITQINCNCGSGFILHPFSATIQPDTARIADYLIEINY